MAGDAPKYCTLHVWVEGRVQGVMFRESTRRMASSLGLSGWVKNSPDGRVEALFAGTREQCERALEFVRTGPPVASVQRVKVEWEETVERPLGGFEIRY